MTSGKRKAIKSLKSINGIGDGIAKKLYDAGIKSKAQAQITTDDDLVTAGLTDTQIKKIRESVEPVLTINRRSLTGIDVDQLIYDGQNHRYTGHDNAKKYPWAKFAHPQTFQAIDAVLWGSPFNAGEIFSNMKINGIDFTDRIVIAEWPNPTTKSQQDKKYVVLEGNRRLRALRKLREDEDNINPEIKAQLKNLEAVEMIYTDRDDMLERAQSMMAVRHLCGTKDWEPFAQSMMIRDTVVKLNSYEAAKEKLGLGKTTIRRRVQAICLFETIQKQFNSPLSETADVSVLLALLGANLWKEDWLDITWTELPPNISIGNSKNMKHIIRKWKGIPAKSGGKNLDSEELDGGENAFRPVTRMLRKIDSSNRTIAQNWFEGAISLADAELQITPLGKKNGWPISGKKATEALTSMTHTELMALDKEGVTELHNLKNNVNTAMKNRKATVTLEVNKLKKPELQELCRERGLEDTGKVDDLRKRLIQGK